MSLENYPKELLAQAALKVFHGTAKSVDFLFYRAVPRNSWVIDAKDRWCRTRFGLQEGKPVRYVEQPDTGRCDCVVLRPEAFCNCCHLSDFQGKHTGSVCFDEGLQTACSKFAPMSLFELVRYADDDDSTAVVKVYGKNSETYTLQFGYMTIIARNALATLGGIPGSVMRKALELAKGQPIEPLVNFLFHTLDRYCVKQVKPVFGDHTMQDVKELLKKAGLDTIKYPLVQTKVGKPESCSQGTPHFKLRLRVLDHIPAQRLRIVKPADYGLEDLNGFWSTEVLNADNHKGGKDDYPYYFYESYVLYKATVAYNT